MPQRLLNMRRHSLLHHNQHFCLPSSSNKHAFSKIRTLKIILKTYFLLGFLVFLLGLMDNLVFYHFFYCKYSAFGML